jgi:hypothetical protein
MVGFAGLSLAQDPAPQQPPAQQRQEGQKPDGGAGADQEVSITGCLTKGTGSGQYVVNGKDGQKIEFNGSSELDQYSNQTVKITGTVSEQGGKATFQPKSVQRVASSCQAQ